MLFVMAAVSAALWAGEAPKQLSVEQAELLARTAAQEGGNRETEGIPLGRRADGAVSRSVLL
jgi:hypothetical protein